MKLAFIGGPSVYEEGDLLYTAGHFGPVVTELASRYDEIILCLGRADRRSDAHDYRLPSNVTFVARPHADSAASGLRHTRRIARAYREAIAQADAVFVRGVMTPAIGTIYEECARRDVPVCHWLVGNPMALLESHRRGNYVKDVLSKAFVRYWERTLHKGHQRARAAYLCNGHEIAARHPSRNCHVTVSTVVTPDDLYLREDTCQTDPVRILCVSYVRPEKGIEYAIRALSLLENSRSVELTIAGSRDRYGAYQARLDRLVNELGLEKKVRWAGHLRSEEVYEVMRKADMLVFPSLSEGTPHALVEALASALPVVSTNVGGIPAIITHGKNGLLVEPKDPEAIACGIDRIIMDPHLRRSLINHASQRAKELTVDKFADQIVNVLQDL